MSNYNVELSQLARYVTIDDTNQHISFGSTVSSLDVKNSGLTIDGDPASGVISASTTYYVTVAGNDTTGDGSQTSPWATPTRAAEYLSQRRIKSGVTVTVSIGNGTYIFTSPIRLDHPQGSQIKYVGAAPSGTKPRGSALNGGGIRGYTTGTEATNDVVLKNYYNVVWQFNSTTGIKVAPETTLVLKNILIRGNSVANDPDSTDAIRVQNGRTGGLGGSIDLDNCSIHNFANRGIALVSGGHATLRDVSITNCGKGIGNSSGVVLGDLGTAVNQVSNLTISNNRSDGIRHTRNATGRYLSSYISNNGGFGIFLIENSSCRAAGATITNNGKRGVAVQQSGSVQLRNATVTGNQIGDISAFSNSYVDFQSIEGTSTANNVSPMFNTTGNNGSFIEN
jgi:parallel beta-helix repeat protein